MVMVETLLNTNSIRRTGRELPSGGHIYLFIGLLTNLINNNYEGIEFVIL